MKKQKLDKKLSLKAETVRSLQPAELTNAAGGASAYCTANGCTVQCPTNACSGHLTCPTLVPACFTE
jgi:hypothetical protein